MQKAVSFDIEIKENVNPSENQIPNKDRLEERKKTLETSDEKKKTETVDIKLEKAEKKRQEALENRQKVLKEQAEKKKNVLNGFNEQMENK